MNPLLKNHIDAIRQLCLEFKVDTLSIYGSITTVNYTEESDIDLLVRFQDDIPLLDFADTYFEFHNKLEKLLDRKVDLAIEKSIQNPYLAQSVKNSKEKIYDRESEKVSL